MKTLLYNLTMSCCRAKKTLCIPPEIVTLLLFKGGMFGSVASGNSILAPVLMIICFRFSWWVPTTIE